MTLEGFNEDNEFIGYDLRYFTSDQINFIKDIDDLPYWINQELQTISTLNDEYISLETMKEELNNLMKEVI